MATCHAMVMAVRKNPCLKLTNDFILLLSVDDPVQCGPKLPGEFGTRLKCACTVYIIVFGNEIAPEQNLL